MPIKSNEIFAKECALQGVFLGVNPHYLMASAQLRSEIKDDADGDRIGPFRVTQAEWNANGSAADLEIILQEPHISIWRKQVTYAVLGAYRSQNRLIETLGRFPSAIELYRDQWSEPDAELTRLQDALDATAGFVEQAVADAEEPAAPPEPDPGQPVAKKGQELFVLKAPRIMEKLIEDFRLSDFQAAGVLGNLGYECNGFRTMQEVKPLVPGSKGGFGWAQWTGPRRTAFEAFCQQQDLSPVSDAANYRFLREELNSTHKSSITELKKTTTIAQAVRVFEKEFERAKEGMEHFERRDEWAALALRVFKSSADSRVPVMIARLLETDMLYAVAAKAENSSAAYWVIDQFSDDGAQFLVKQEIGQDPVILASDTTIFPLKAGLVPPAIGKKLSAGVVDAGPSRPVVVQPPSDDDALRKKVFEEAKKSVDTLISRNVPNTSNGRLACAWAVNEVVRRASGKPIGGGLSTIEMGKVLRKRHVEKPESDLAPGMIVISPTGAKVGHVGIVGEIASPRSATPIFSNSSNAGKFAKNFTIASWKKRYIDKQHLPVLFYALKA